MKSITQKISKLSVSATGMKTIQLKDFEEKFLILYFYPKDSTPGCTQEGKDFAKLYKQIKKQGAEVLGVSKDSINSHEKFKKKQKYPFDLISDEKGELCKAFKVLKKKSMFGKTYTGIDRSTFVISEGRVIEKAWRNVKVPGHAKEVLDFIKTL